MTRERPADERLLNQNGEPTEDLRARFPDIAATVDAIRAAVAKGRDE